jgi:hypothetical protein
MINFRKDSLPNYVLTYVAAQDPLIFITETNINFISMHFNIHLYYPSSGVFALC